VTQQIGQESSTRLRSIIASVILFGVIGVLAFAVLNQRYILDYIALRNYQPSDIVVNMATEDALTPQARKIFYVNHPDISDKASFSSKCTSGKSKERTIVLGCYHGNQGGIFVLGVNDPRLTGVEQVTAAHEMLHAAYDRLSASDKNKIDGLLLDYYHNGLTDERIKTTINAYKQSEPADVVNEMHSIFGTEVVKLPAPLEAYYTQYFTSRAKVTAYASQYQAEFSSRLAAVKQYDAELSSLKSQIDALNAALKNEQQAITDQQTALNSYKSSGNISAYNKGVPTYNALVDDFNTKVGTVQGLVDDYNSLVTKRNAIAIEQQELANALSSSAATIK
jgi:hypothetical protein